MLCAIARWHAAEGTGCRHVYTPSVSLSRNVLRIVNTGPYTVGVSTQWAPM